MINNLALALAEQSKQQITQRDAQRAARPPLLKAMYRHLGEVHRLADLAQLASEQHKGRREALKEIYRRLRGLRTLMLEDAKAAESGEQIAR